MANSKVGQYRMEFLLQGWTSPVRTHVCGLWVAPLTTPTPGSLPSDIAIQLKGGGNDTLDDVALGYAERVRVFYPSSISISEFTLWRYETEFQRTFITSGNVTTTAAASPGFTAAWQATVTFRHANGGVSRHTFLEPRYSGNSFLALNAPGVPVGIQQYRDYILSSISPAIALDNSFAVTGLRFGEEENEFIQNKLYRPS